MQCSEAELILENAGLSALPEAARAHLDQCGACSSLFADFSAIAATAKELPPEVDPPPQIFITLRNQLEAEGLIHDRQTAQTPRSGWSLGNLFGTRALAACAVLLMLTAVAVTQLKKPGVVILPPPPESSFASTATLLNEQERDLANMQLASTTAADQSLRQNLQTVDEFIADCERRVKEEPQDQLAREYLSSAYQQKAQLLSAIMERGGSLN